MFPGKIAETAPDRAAVTMAASGVTLTYRQLDEGANRVSRLMASHGLKPGDHVAICLENNPRFFEVVWGCHYAGLVYTCCSSRLNNDVLSYIINDCAAKIFITSKYMSEQAEGIVAATPGVVARYMLDGSSTNYDSFESSIAAHQPTPLTERFEGTDMLYSSGTTGRPKGVAFVYKPEPLGTPPGLLTLAQFVFGFNEQTVYLSPAPLYHAAPLRFNMAVHRLGGTTVIMEHFDENEYLAAIPKFKVSHTQVVPTMFVRMLKLADADRMKHDVSTLKTVIHAAAPCPVEVKRKMIEWWGPIIHEYYAGTEGNGFVYCNSEQWLAHPGTVGQAISGILHILDEEGNELPVGETGTVFFESPAVFEYHNDPEKTKSSRDPKGRGWSTLGDIGYMDADKFLYLTDRKAFMIISGGVNIYPQEAENVLINHPKVADVAVFGVPNEEFGEEVKAVVQPVAMPDTPAESAALAKELIAYCREHLAHLKCPRTIDFRAELPRHPTGKLYKRLLKDEYWKNAGRSI